MFCHDLYSNIQTHIENKHANKKEEQEIKTMKQKKEFCNTEEKTDLMKEINRKVTLIRNKGDNIQNMSVLQKGEGEILLSRRTQNNNMGLVRNVLNGFSLRNQLQLIGPLVQRLRQVHISRAKGLLSFRLKLWQEKSFQKVQKFFKKKFFQR